MPKCPKKTRIFLQKVPGVIGLRQFPAFSGHFDEYFGIFHQHLLEIHMILSPAKHKQRKTTQQEISQPRSQGLSSYCPLGGSRRDRVWVWSCATLTIENIREGSSVIKQFVALGFVALRPPLPAIFNCYSSLRAEILNGTLYLFRRLSKG